MRGAASILITAYGLMLVGVGTVGILFARWELTTIFGVDPAAMPADEATFLNQYRFLKAVELGAGAFCLCLRRPIADGAAAAWPFVVLVAGGVAARSLAWASDGRPSAAFLAFLALEILVLAVVGLHLGRRHAG